MLHVPVLLAETVARLVTAPGGWYVDATAGARGLSRGGGACWGRASAAVRIAVSSGLKVFRG